jgi:signal transduction histidine kinase
MPTPDAWPLRRWDVVARTRATLDALEHLVGGVGTAILAILAAFVTVITALACLLGVGLFLVPTALHVLRIVADRERGRLSRWGPDVVISPDPVPSELRAAITNPASRRELCWALIHGFFGLLLGALGMTLPLSAVRDLTFPLWWRLMPDGAGVDLWVVRDLPSALAVAALGVGWIALALALVPGMARVQAWPGRLLLAADPSTDLALRVAQLTATRAEALDAHAAELRRIERSLHDGTQNRLVAVNVMLGAARRALARDPATADAMLERAQDAAEQALAELRAVSRSILPPVLTDRSLADALTGLAAGCPVPCRIDVDLPGRCAASVEATAYFVVAEGLTNIAKYSQARLATVTIRRHDDRLDLRITDDGRGGADERRGSGLAGIRRRAEALDGTFALTSPEGGPTTMNVSLPCGL